MSFSRFIMAVALVPFMFAGCKKGEAPAAKTADGRTRIRVGIIGLTCEAPVFCAAENGYFTEEGLEAELIRCDWSRFQDALALQSFDVAHQPVMMFLKAVEQGLDVKMTAGIHQGCLRVQAPLNGPIKTVEDLRGKRIGVPGMGTPPFLFASRVLQSKGINPRDGVTWRVFSSGELGLALQTGQVDAVANSEPIGSLLLAEGKVQNVADQAVELPYAEEYCCTVLLHGKYIAQNPKAAAAVTRAIMKGAKWVETNPAAAARLSVEKKYITSHPELNTTALGKLRYIPSVSGGERAVSSAAVDMQKAGMLNASTDVAALAKRVFVRLDGVTDDWVKSLEVEKVAGGQIPLDQAQRVALELLTIGAPTFASTCCSASSKIVQEPVK